MATKTKFSKAVLAILAACGLMAIMAMAACSSPTASSSSSSSSQVMQVTDTSQSSSASAVPAKGAYNVLLMGNDKWVADTPGHPDMVCVLRVDLDNHKIYEVTVPRDSTVYTPEGNKTKLNDYMTEKPRSEQIALVEQVTGMDIDYYVEIGFTGLEEVVDSFGGVPMNLPFDCLYHFYTNDYPDEQFTAGEQVLDGFHAMAISRARTGYGDQGIDNQDMVRQYVCREMLKSLVQLAYDGGVDSAQGIVTKFQGAVETDIPLETQLAWVAKLGETGSFEMVGTTGPFDGDVDPDADIFLCFEDHEGWAALKDAVETGGDLQVAVDSFQFHEFTDQTPGVATTTITVG